MRFEVFEGQAAWPAVAFRDEGKVDVAAGTRGFRFLKRTVDIVTAVLALPIIGVMTVVLVCINPWTNPGPVFFRQMRMGAHGVPFMLLKFRTMTHCPVGKRAHDEKVEAHRITPLGAILRRYRIDEIPNFINVLRGEMSLIGPRPEVWDHANVFLRTIPGYEERFRILPGITGLAQVCSGYADEPHLVRRKARYDGFYVRHVGARLDTLIVAKTLKVILTGFGAK